MLYIGRYGQWWEKEEEEGKKKHGERNAIQDMADVGWMDGSRADEHRTNAESERKIEEKKHTEIEVENRRADTEWDVYSDW